jgi:predicted RecB family nuclease
MAYEPIPRIKATWIERYEDSPISFWCDQFASRDEEDPLDVFTEHLFRVGQEHQARTVAESYPESVQRFFATEEEGFAITYNLMVAGEQAISNMPLISDSHGLEGRPDLLVRNDSFPSAFGSYAYELIEIKSARNIRASHVLQAASYNRMLGDLQGFEPPEFLIINRDGGMVRFLMKDWNGHLDGVVQAIRRVMGGEAVPPIFGTGKWPWEGYVDRLAIQAGDISLIPGIGPARREGLSRAGFVTIDSIAGSTEASLTQIKGIRASTALTTRTAAEALVTGKPVLRARLEPFRQATTEVFLDLEGTDPRIGVEDLEVVNYLIGTVVRIPGMPASYVPFFASAFAEEERNLRAFYEWADSLEDPLFYHWHHYERTHLSKMATHYGLPEKLTTKLSTNMVDLSPITTRAYAFPAYGQGLKAIARSLGFNWRQGDVGALISVALYLRYVESDGKDDEARQMILDYNEDDCLATIARVAPPPVTATTAAPWPCARAADARWAKADLAEGAALEPPRAAEGIRTLGLLLGNRNGSSSVPLFFVHTNWRILREEEDSWHEGRPGPNVSQPR